MSNPWNGKVVLQAFWWNCWNNNFAHDWFTFLATLAPRLAALGFDGLWTPQPCKDSHGTESMGYLPYDYYDLGAKNQIGTVYSRFGTQDAFLRMIAVAHANGLEIYPDIVLDHCDSGAQDPAVKPVGFAGAGTGRWPRSTLDFHGNPVHHNLSGDWCPTPGNSFGNDICYQGRCSDSGAADPNCYMRAQARAWLTWFVQQTNVDGFRFDDVKGFPPEIVEDILFNAMGDRRDFFCVGEFLPNSDPNGLDNWADSTLNRAGTFDYPLRSALVDFVYAGGFYDVGSLPSMQQHNRFKTVPFVNNHDVWHGEFWDSSGDNQHDHTGFSRNGQELDRTLDPDNPRTPLAYAFAVAVDGSPQIFYEDLFVNFEPLRDKTTADALPTRPYIQNLVWCHQKLEFKSSAYLVRFQGSRELLILERSGRAIIAINNDGNAWHDAWIPTAFWPNTQLHDYSGARNDDIWTNQDSWVNIAVPPLSYSVWGQAGITGGFALPSRRTLQQFEMDDDLGDSTTPFQYGGKAVSTAFRNAGAIWPAKGSTVNVFIYADSDQQVDLLIAPAGSAAVKASGTATATVPLTASFVVSVETWHVLTAKLSIAGAASARLYFKVDYVGPPKLTGI